MGSSNPFLSLCAAFLQAFQKPLLNSKHGLNLRKKPCGKIHAGKRPSSACRPEATWQLQEGWQLGLLGSRAASTEGQGHFASLFPLAKVFGSNATIVSSSNPIMVHKSWFLSLIYHSLSPPLFEYNSLTHSNSYNKATSLNNICPEQHSPICMACWTLLRITDVFAFQLSLRFKHFKLGWCHSWSAILLSGGDLAAASFPPTCAPPATASSPSTAEGGSGKRKGCCKVGRGKEIYEINATPWQTAQCLPWPGQFLGPGCQKPRCSPSSLDWASHNHLVKRNKEPYKLVDKTLLTTTQFARRGFLFPHF